VDKASLNFFLQKLKQLYSFEMKTYSNVELPLNYVVKNFFVLGAWTMGFVKRLIFRNENWSQSYVEFTATTPAL
jgi:hypothetical protein